MGPLLQGEIVPAGEGWGRCGLAQCLGPWWTCCLSPCWLFPSLGPQELGLCGPRSRAALAPRFSQDKRGLGHCRELKRPGQSPVVAPTHTKMPPGSLVSQSSTLDWTTGSAGGTSHAAVGPHRKLVHPGHPKAPGGTNLCDSRQRSWSPVTPVSGRDSSGGECSVWQIRG